LNSKSIVLSFPQVPLDPLVACLGKTLRTDLSHSDFPSCRQSTH